VKTGSSYAAVTGASIRPRLLWYEICHRRFT